MIGRRAFDHLSPDEQEQLDTDPDHHDERFAAAGRSCAGRPPARTTWSLAGWPQPTPAWRHRSGPHGAYVCGSLKEEFGLAVLEALAAGLVVVAPQGGGPATYVEDGFSGLLVNTSRPAQLSQGMHAALDRAAAPDGEERAGRTLQLIRDRFTVQAMARTLAGVYAGVAETSSNR